MEVAYLLPALALGQIFWSATFGPGLALRAMESPRSVFVGLAVATVASVLVGLPATWAFGLKGAIWGSNLADFLSFGALVYVLKRKLDDHTATDSPVTSKRSVAKIDVQSSIALESPEEA